MKTVTQLDNLQTLGSILQERLCAAFPEIVYFQVNCVLENGMLMVEIEHPQDHIPAPESLLPVVETALADLQVDSALPVNTYVKMPGLEHPYGLYSFTLLPLGQRSRKPSQNRSRILTKTNRGANAPTEPFAANPWDENDSDSLIGEPVDSFGASDTSGHRSGNFKPVAIALGSILGLGVFGLTLYGLTRPCVVGGCQAMTVAQELHQQSNREQAASQSATEISKAQAPLEDAIARLETIPSWSGSYSQAQALKSTYRTQINQLNSVRVGLSQIEQANTNLQKPPLTVAQWRDSEKLWQISIANLQQVPADSSAYPLAQTKIKQSRTNLATAKIQIPIAQKSENLGKQGEEKARVAKALQGIAQSPPEWQKVKQGWQGAITELQKVEKGTAAYQPAQKSLINAQKQLKVAKDRQSQEDSSASKYNSARQLAQKAEDLQVDDKWSNAVANWSQAVNLVQQVPVGTFYYGKAQPLIPRYKEALSQARVQLALANKRRDRAQQALQKLCSTKPAICQFKVVGDTIQVKLTPFYTQAVKQASLAAKKKGDYNTQAAIVDRVLALGETLNTISTNFKLRLELYGDNGKIVQVYNPGR
jgi:hypothetical protein